jgi:hypothetical protein
MPRLDAQFGALFRIRAIELDSDRREDTPLEDEAAALRYLVEDRPFGRVLLKI